MSAAAISSDLPLIDLHRHLDGALRLATVLDLGKQHGVSLPASDLDGLRRAIEVRDREPSLLEFLARFEHLTAVLVDPEACYRVAYENVEDAHAEGLDHVELRFSPWFMAERYGLDPAAVTDAVVEGARAGALETGLSVGLIGILSRTYGVEICARELDALLTRAEALVALDLAGDEAGFPAALFVRHFERARDAGLGVTVHAGEGAGADSVWAAIRDLGATRIGHGARAIEDPNLVEHLATHGIGVEANLTSNLQTSTVASLADHPLRAFLDRGVKATLNTDDPTISGIDLRHEYEVAGPAAGLGAEHLRQAQANALDMAFLDDGEKAALATRAAARVAD